MILLVVLLVCCFKRRSERDPERSGGDRSQGQSVGGQFACCNHGVCTGSNTQLHMEQRTPLRPFVLRSDPDALTYPKAQQQRIISLNRRNSTESQKSAGTDESTSTSYSSDSEGPLQRDRKKFHKRPPPLKLTSLVTPVINGPQDNPRRRVDRSLRSEPV